jgi:hypothetical protein
MNTGTPSLQTPPTGNPGEQTGPRPIDGPDDAFLARVEAARLARKCHRSIDLRHRTAEPCKLYRSNGQLHWLDHTSYVILREGLQRNAGVFTNATYEAILSQALSPGDAQKAEAPPFCSDYPSALAPISGGDPRSLRHFHELLEMGYFAKRQELRVKHAVRVLLIAERRTIPARTRDISYNGIQVRTKFPTDLVSGNRVGVAIHGHDELKEATASYRVVRVRHRLNESLISLHCDTESPYNPVRVFLRACINERLKGDRAAQRFDTEDVTLTAVAMLAERFYMRSTSLLPFFLKHDAPGDVRIELLLSNEVNRRLAKAFEYAPNQYDFSGMNDQQRTRQLLRLSRLDGHASAMIAVHCKPPLSRVDVVADFDHRHTVDWYAHLARHQRDENVKVFQILICSIRRPSEKRLTHELRSLKHKSQDRVREIRQCTDRLVAQGALVDITGEVRTWNLEPYRPVSTPVTHAKAEDPPHLPEPAELLSVDYAEMRQGEERYELWLHVELRGRGRSFTAVTRDVSSQGLCLALPTSEPTLESGDVLCVTFPELVRQATVVEQMQRRFVNVSYVVVASQTGDDNLVRLRLRDPDEAAGFVKSLTNYLEKCVLPVRSDASNSLRATTARLYSSVFVENSPAVPIFFFRKEPGAVITAKVGVTHYRNPLAAFFETEDGRYDFSAITMPQRVANLVAQATAQGLGAMTLFMLKRRIQREARYTIDSIADPDFGTEQVRRDFFAQLPCLDFRILRIITSSPKRLPSAETELIFERLRTYSSRRAAGLRQEWETLVAVGDVIDISGQLESFQRFGRTAN